MRSFTVQEGLMGFAVTIGCQMCFFSTKEELAEKVNEYILNPEETEKKYYASKACRNPPPEPTTYAGMGGLTRIDPIEPAPIAQAATSLRRG